MKRPEQFRDPQLETSGEVIGFYPREFYPFDNFSAFPVEYMGQVWPTSEHAYHAMKFSHARDVFREIESAKSPHDALLIARAYHDQAPDDWGTVKVAVMEDICRQKMLQNPYVREKLLQTGDMEIIEDSPKDSFWGWGPNRDGRNELGKIWMRLRHEVRPDAQY